MVHIIPASEGCLTSSANRTFFFTFFYFLSSANTTLHHNHPHQQLFLLSQIFIIIAILPFLTILTHMFFSPAMVAYPVNFFYFYFHSFLFSFFLLFNFNFQDIFYFQVCGHTYHPYGIAAYTAYYRLLRLFCFQLFLLFCC